MTSVSYTHHFPSDDFERTNPEYARQVAEQTDKMARDRWPDTTVVTSVSYAPETTLSIDEQALETAAVAPHPGVAEWASTFDPDEVITRVDAETCPDLDLLGRVCFTIARMGRDRSTIASAAHGVDFGEGFDERRGDTDTRYGDLADPYAAIRRYATSQGVTVTPAPYNVGAPATVVNPVSYDG